MKCLWNTYRWKQAKTFNRSTPYFSWIGVLVVFLATPALAANPGSAANRALADGNEPPAYDAGMQGLPAAFNAIPMSDQELGEIRAGFITVNGIELDIGFELRTIINGVVIADQAIQLTSPTSHMVGKKIKSVVLWNEDGGTTSVNHELTSGGLNSTVVNSQNNVSIQQFTTLSVTVINHAQLVGAIRSGIRTGLSPKLSNIMKDALMGAVAR